MNGLVESLQNSLLVTGSPSVGQLLAAFGISYLGGVFTSFTPCVYPMIPITVGVVGGMARKKGNLLELSLRIGSYVAGLVLVYAVLGVLAGLTGRIFGTFTQTSAWYISIGVMITFASLIMLEVIPFDPSVWWAQIKTRFFKSAPTSAPASSDLSYLGAFSLGASSGLIAAPCTTPVLTTVLAFIAQTQSVGLGLFLMIAFALGISTLLVLIAYFAGTLQILPRSGNWLKWIKLSSGLILLAFAMYLIYRAGTLGGTST